MLFYWPAKGIKLELWAAVPREHDHVDMRER